jgi:hypothetical protein
VRLLVHCSQRFLATPSGCPRSIAFHHEQSERDSLKARYPDLPVDPDDRSLVMAFGILGWRITDLQASKGRMNKRLCPWRAATQAVTRETLWFNANERPGLNTPGLASRYRVRPCRRKEYGASGRRNPARAATRQPCCRFGTRNVPEDFSAALAAGHQGHPRFSSMNSTPAVTEGLGSRHIGFVSQNKRDPDVCRRPPSSRTGGRFWVDP